MKKGIFREATIILICLALLLISVTTAWMFNIEILPYRFIKVDYTDKNVLRISATDIVIKFLYLDETTGEYVEAPSDYFLELKDIVPNDMVQFRLRIWNTSGTSQAISLQMTDISAVRVTETEEGIIESHLNEQAKTTLFEMMYVGFKGGHGYADSTYPDIVLPEEKFICFEDSQPMATEESLGKDSLLLYRNLIVPPTGKDYAELNGFLWLNRDATYDELADVKLKIEHFRATL